MKLIAHRGNINGPHPAFENSPEYIQEALDKGFDVEVDLRIVDGKLYLGHDNPDYLIDEMFLIQRYDKLWIHAKNKAAVRWLFFKQIYNWFWHQTDYYTMTSKGWLWAYPGHEVVEGVCVMPEDSPKKDRLVFENYMHVCSDYVADLSKIKGVNI